MTRVLKTGERKGKASKLTADDVRQARALHAKGLLNIREYALFCGVGAETLRRAVRGETWTDISFSGTPSEEELAIAAQASAERFMQAIAMEKEKLAAGDNMLKELEAEPAATTANPYNWLKPKASV